MAKTISSSNLSVSISFGFLEGDAQARRFTKQLRGAGFKHSQSTAHSDVVVAHSAGCWLIPRGAEPKLTMYVGMPLAQSRAWRTLWHSNWNDVKHLSFRQVGRVIAGSAYHGASQPLRNVRIATSARAAKPSIPDGGQHVFIANQHDPWIRDKKLQHYLDNHDWVFISLPGSHDNIWEHPGHYIAIIKHYARLLA